MSNLLQLLEPICYNYVPQYGDIITLYGATEHELVTGWIADIKQNRMFATLIIDTGEMNHSFTFPFLLNPENGIILVVN